MNWSYDTLILVLQETVWLYCIITLSPSVVFSEQVSQQHSVAWDSEFFYSMVNAK